MGVYLRIMPISHASSVRDPEAPFPNTDAPFLNPGRDGALAVGSSLRIQKVVDGALALGYSALY